MASRALAGGHIYIAVVARHIFTKCHGLRIYVLDVYCEVVGEVGMGGKGDKGREKQQIKSLHISSGMGG